VLGSVVGRIRLLVALAAVMLVSGALGAVAQAEVTHSFQFSFGGTSTPAGAFDSVGAIAVDEASGNIWVDDPNSSAVYEFDSSGNYAGVEIDASSVPGEAWEVENYSGIAVDNSGRGDEGDVYVSNERSGVIDKFDSNGKFISELKASDTPDPSFHPMGLAVDGSGDLYVGDGNEKTVDEFNEAGVFVSKLSSLAITAPARIAVDSHGDVYVTNYYQDVVKVEPGGGATVIEIGLPAGVAVERSSGDVYVGEGSNGEPPANPVLEYDASGSLLGVFGGAQKSTPAGVAIDEKTGGGIYVSDYAGRAVDVYGPAVVVPDVVAGAVSAIGQTSVVLNGTVNPDGVPVTGCEFEYGTSTSYEGSVPCEQAPGSIGSGASPVAVSAVVKGLASGTEYHFRLVASNANGPNHGSDATFQTGAPAIVGPWAANVASTSATLSADIDPLGLSTQYRLEYGAGLPYEHVLAGSVGEGHAPVLVSYHLQGLPSGTTYHYRLLVTNSLGSVEGGDHTFSTQAVENEFTLPDGRAWELVSPPDKRGALITLTGTSQVIQAASDGNAMAYTVTEPIGEGEKGHASSPEIFAQRTASGWENTDIGVRQEVPAEGTSYQQFGNEKSGAKYDLFSQDLSLGALEELEQTPLSPEATKRTVYERNNSAGNYIPLVTPSNTPAGTNFGGEAEQEPMRFEAATPDLSHVVFASGTALTPNALEESKVCPTGTGCTVPGDNLYEWVGGRLKLVSVLPDGKAIAGGLVGGELGEEGGMSARVVSNDGRWVVWNYHAFSASPEDGLYLWDALTEKSVKIGGANALFEDMSADGSRIFYLEGNVEPNDSELGSSRPQTLTGNLYMFDSETGTSTDLTPANGGESAGVENAVMGASEDGSYVYFVAHGVLARGARGGANNLYVMHDDGTGWVTTFIATLSPDDQRSWTRGHQHVLEYITALQYVSSRVSSNGRYLTFMSDRPLTGYDNSDAESGQPDEEVFLYDALENKLACVSCDPSGARPVGQFDFLKAGESSITIDPLGAWSELGGTGNHWLAGFLPGWRGVYRLRNTLATYQPRYLSSSGRLFFDSPVALVPQDTNGLEDVYEYEPPGVGDCSTSSSTFSERSGGCVNLISSGTSASESVFVDASENGDDAFFITTAKLVGEDYDTSPDIYDAHVCSAAAPCHSVPVAPPPCTSGDSCKPAPSPQPDIFGPPPSATFSGTGNVHPEAAKSPVKAKSKAKAKKKRKLVRKKRKHKQSKRRSSVKRASGKDRK
jgi:hypothetical protein